MSRWMDDEEVKKFGFRFGPMDVVRATEHEGTHYVQVVSDYVTIDVSVSPTGRSVRVFRNGEELKAAPEGEKE